MINRDEIIERTGNTSWNDVEEWFGGKSESEILTECNRIWREDDNEELAASIYSELN